MFKSATIFKITKLPATSLDTREAAAACQQFAPITAQQERSVGWAPARGEEHAALVECVNGNDIMRFTVESKSVPATAVTAKAKEVAKRIEADTGRKPGRKEMRELKDDAKATLMIHAIPRTSSTLVWIDRKNMRLVIDTGSTSRTDEIVSLLVKTFEGLAVGLLLTEVSPSAAMSSWLLGNEVSETAWLDLGDFSVGHQCRLQAFDESKAVVSYSRHALDIDEVRQHIRQGKVPTALELAYAGRLTFTLTAAGTLTKIKLLEAATCDADYDTCAFEADVAIITGELSALIESLVTVLGGEVPA